MTNPKNTLFGQSNYSQKGKLTDDVDDVLLRIHMCSGFGCSDAAVLLLSAQVCTPAVIN